MEEEHVKGDGVAKSPPNAFFPTSITICTPSPLKNHKAL
jgi:hypothetical protein